MKVSVSLPTEDVEFLDEFARERRLESRSVALQLAVHLLRTRELAVAYAGAWDRWKADPDHGAWEAAVGDGIPPRSPTAT